jgi:hypothetical protein
MSVRPIPLEERMRQLEEADKQREFGCFQFPARLIPKLEVARQHNRAIEAMVKQPENDVCGINWAHEGFNEGAAVPPKLDQAYVLRTKQMALKLGATIMVKRALDCGLDDFAEGLNFLCKTLLKDEDKPQPKDDKLDEVKALFDNFFVQLKKAV